MVCALHALMFVYDMQHPWVLLNADRAGARLATIQGLFAAWNNGDLSNYLVSHGILGDYIPQALVTAAVGVPGLIFLQIILALISGYAVFSLGQLLGLSRRLSIVSCVIYLLLPHTLLYPHQLASEAWFTPMLVISLWMCAKFMERPNHILLIASALLLGLTSLIRPISLLWPLFVALLMVKGKQARAGVYLAGLATAPMLIWVGFVGLQSGTIGMGVSSFDMGHNLYQRVKRISATLPQDGFMQVQKQFLNQGENGSLGLGDYARFATQYFRPFLGQSARDSGVFFGKSGIERISLDYLELNSAARAEIQSEDRGWRKQLEVSGVVSAFKFLWHTQGSILLISLLGSMVLLLMMGMAAIGAWDLLRQMRRANIPQQFTASMIMALPVYILLFTQVVDAMQSRHRAPAEAALILLAMWGWARAYAMRKPQLHPLYA